MLPPAGGTILRQYCPTEQSENDSTNLLEAPAVSLDQRILYHQVVSWIGQQKLGNSAVMLGAMNDPVQATRLLPLPYTAPDGKLHSSIRSPVWTGPHTVTYLAEMLFYEGSTFYPDTFFTGLEVAQVDVSQMPAAVQVIPGTDYASSVAVKPGEPGVIYYTIGGDSQVYRRDLTSGSVRTVHNFGSGNIARDVSLSGTHLVAIVGRSVVYQFEPAHSGYVQRDEGGDLHFVDLSSGSDFAFGTDSVLFRHPVFSPDGRHVVVEASPFAPPHTQPQSDYTATNHRDDLWLFEVP